jgi:hypothetical protein
MRQKVRHFIRQCPVCQKSSQENPMVYTMPFTTATYEPMERLNIDSIGPLPPTTDGYQYILVIIDCFTRFIELFPIKTVNAEEAAYCLLQHLGRYGTPSQIKSDKGSQFVNDVIRHLLATVGIEHKLSLAYSKEENAIVERSNKEVLRHLNAILFDKNITESWCDYLPLVQRIMNATIHSSIGVSPAALLFGNSTQLDRGIFLPIAEHAINEDTSKPPEKLSEWVKKMLLHQSTLIGVAQQYQKEKDKLHISSVDINNITFFPVGTFVLVRYPKTAFGRKPPSKLNLSWKGPLRVVSRQGDKYKLQNLVTEKEEEHHSRYMKEFIYDSTKVDPRLIANKDSFMTDIKSILKHKPPGKQTKVSKLKFLVHWDGDTSDLWEPWNKLRLTEKLHDYLRNNKMASLIPKNII